MNVSPTTSSHRRRLVPAFVFLLTATLPAAAQTAATPPAATFDNDVLRLDPFSVKAGEDEGYMASNTVSGTALNMQLKDVPMAINIITSEFLRDANLTEMLRALDYSTSVTQANRGDVNTRGSLFSIRGFRTRNVLLDGVAAGDYIPSQLIDRIEIVKGPNTLYGQSDPGGLINMISKRPLSSNFVSLRGSYGSWNTYRGAVDINRTLSDKLAIRVLGSYLDTDGWHVVDGRTSKFGAMMADWKPLEHTKLQLTYSTNLDTLNPANRSTSPFDIVPTDLNGDGDTNDTVDGVPEASARYNNSFVPWDWTSQTDKNWQRRSTEFMRAAVTQNLGRHLDAQYQFIRSTQNLITNFRGFNTFNAAGNNAADYTFERQYNRTDAHSFNLNGRFDTGPLKHNLVAGVRYTEDTGHGYYLGLRPAVAAELAKLNQLAADTGRTFRLNLTRRDVLNGLDIFHEDTPTKVDFYKYGTYFNSTDTTYEDVTTFYLSDSVSLMEERLRLLFGVRNITIKNYADSIGGQRLTATNKNHTSRDTSTQFGINYRINENVVPFANYATAFNPNGFDATTGDYYAPERSKAWEVGVKFDNFLSNRVFGTVSYFNINKENVVRSNYTPGPPPGSITEVSDDEARGVDVELFVNITPQWQVTFGYSYLDAKTVRSATTAKGLRLEGAAPQKYSLWTSYKINSGALKGLRFGGGGFQVIGKVQQFGTSNFRLHYQDGYYEVAAFIRYDTKLMDAPVSFALNGNNLTDQQYYRSRGSYDDPRNITFSAELKF